MMTCQMSHPQSDDSSGKIAADERPKYIYSSSPMSVFHLKDPARVRLQKAAQAVDALLLQLNVKFIVILDWGINKDLF